MADETPRAARRVPRRLLSWGGATLLVGAAFAGGVLYGEKRVHDRDEWSEGRLLSTAIDSVRANALDSLPNDELIRRAVSGMLRELHDPYAALLRPDSYTKYRNSLQGVGQGLGLTLRRQPLSDGVTLWVSRVAPGSPAAASGIRAGDRLVSVNGRSVAKGWTRTANDTTSAGTDTARLAVVRTVVAKANEKPSPDDTLRMTLVRAPWHAPAVADAALLTDSVGYVRLSTITARSTAELENAVESLRERGARSLVLDLRGNAGGLFDEGVKTAGLFLPRGALVASLDARRGAPPERHVNRNTRWPSMPLTVLVDAGTASAAEIIAAALRDHGRALLVGSRTYGKGVVQRVVPITKELSLRLTTARWLTPNGETLERRSGAGDAARGGLVPDVVLDDASRKDMFSLPRDWPRDATLRLSSLADSAAARAVREGWPSSSVADIESQLRATISASLPPTVRGERARASWTHVATRLGTVRALERGSHPDLLVQYSVRDDAALRAGVEVLAPGSPLTRVTAGALGIDAGTRRK